MLDNKAASTEESLGAFLAHLVISRPDQIKPQQAVEHTQKIMRSLQSLTIEELNQVFDEYDLCNAMVTHLSAISSKLLELNVDAVELTIAQSKKVAP